MCQTVTEEGNREKLENYKKPKMRNCTRCQFRMQTCKKLLHRIASTRHCHTHSIAHMCCDFATCKLCEMRMQRHRSQWQKEEEEGKKEKSKTKVLSMRSLTENKLISYHVFTYAFKLCFDLFFTRFLFRSEFFVLAFVECKHRKMPPRLWSRRVDRRL